MRFQLLVLVGLLFNAPAVADISNETIRAYNEALSAGEEPGIIETSKALAAEAVANPEHSQAVLLAFEAASQLCTRGACKDAKTAANFVANAPITDPTAHPVSEDRILLNAFAEWTDKKSSKTRKELDAALDTITPMAPTNLSIDAMQARYSYDLAEGRLGSAAETAGQAGDHIRPIATEAPGLYASSEFLAAVSLFNSRQSRMAHEDMAHLQGWLSQFREALGDEAPDWVSQQYYRAYAWRLTMDAWFQSAGLISPIHKRNIDDILASYENEDSETDVAGDTDSLPFCKGVFRQIPRLRFNSRQIADRFGSVIITTALKDGKSVDPVVRAAVPEGVFEDNIVDTIAKWTWEPEEGQNIGIDCSMSADESVHSFVFIIR